MILVACTLGAVLPAMSQEPTPEDKYLRRLKVNDAIEPVGPTPFGEELNIYTGDLTFRQTDLVLEGTGPTISLTRELVSVQTSDARMGPSSMGDWVLSIPRIETLTQAPWGTTPITNPGQYWVVGGNLLTRCTNFDRPLYTGGLTDPEAAWNGMDLISESGERQGILRRIPGSPIAPSMLDSGGSPVVFKALTLGNWQIGCLPNTSNGEPGEAFLAVSPDGMKYRLDYLTGERAYAEFERKDGATFRQFRMFANMYASRVEDRFGNYVDYHYTGDKLTSITASDGRAVSLTWRTDAPVISQIATNPGTPQQRIWQYQYNVVSAEVAILTRVVLPDGSAWQFNLVGLGGRALTDWRLPQCYLRTLPSASSGGQTSTIVHPGGATGTFLVRGVWHSRSYVPSLCMLPTDISGEPYERLPSIFGTASLVSKTISGPGITSGTWTYAYSAAAGSATYDACAASNTCADTRWVDVTDPDGNRTRYTYSNRWGDQEGKLLKTETFQGNSTLLRTQVLSYAAGNQGPYPAQVGQVLSGYDSNFTKQETWTPQKLAATTQQGRRFTWEVPAVCGPNGTSDTQLCFDQFARPTKVVKSSAPAP